MTQLYRVFLPLANLSNYMPTLMLSALHLLALPLLFSPVPQNLSPSTFLPGNMQVGPASGAQQVSASALGANSTLLVWDDARSGTFDIYGIRLDANGQTLDATPFPVCTSAGDQRAPRVAWNGQDWLVVFDSNTPIGGYFTHQVAAVRVSGQGVVLDTTPIAFGSSQSAAYYGVASDGNNWVIASTGTSGNTGILARRVSPAGVVLDPAGVEIVPATYFIYFNVDLAYTSGVFLTTWNESAGTKGLRFNSSLVNLDTTPRLFAPSGRGRLAANTTQFFLAWERPGWYIYTDVLGTRIDPAGNVLNATPISISANESYGPNPTVTWSGSQWVVAWLKASRAYAARVSTIGTVLDPSGVSMTSGTANQYSPSIGALPGGSSLVVWDDIRNSNDDLYGNTLSAAGVAGTEKAIAVSPESLTVPRIATGDGIYLVTYRAAGASTSRILAQRVAKSGVALDANPFEVTSASHVLLTPGGAAWNGSVFLIVWADGQQSKIFARRMDSNGVFLDPSPIFVLPGWTPDVAALDNDFLVCGLRTTGYPHFVDSFATRVRGIDGVVLDNPNLWIGTSFAARTRLTTLGGRWLAVTESHFSHDDSQYGIVYSFIDALGVSTPQASLGGGIAGGSEWGMVDVASSHASAVVVYSSGSNWINSNVYAARLLPNGTISHTGVLLTSTAVSGQSKPTVAWTGKEYVVLYQTLQNNPENYDLEPDVYGVRLSEGCALLDSVGWPVWNTEYYEKDPIGRSLKLGASLLASAAFDPSAGAFRISTRVLRPNGLSNYGVGTPGCNGAQYMDASSAATIGDPAFTLLTDHVPPVSLGLGLVTDVKDTNGSDTFAVGILFHVSFVGATDIIPYDIVSDANGNAAATVGVPNDAALIGRKFYSQTIWYWGGICSLPPQDLSSSNGLEIVIQAP
ncbi:MAG: hypothetical protein ACKVS6_07530 [Planctomycetota bacterium]